MSLFLRPSSSSKSIPNTFLRKKRKWPHSPYKTKWHYLFAQQQAMHKLKSLASSPPQTLEQSVESETLNPNPLPYLLSSLVTSFKAYDCEPTPSAYHFVVRTLTRSAQFAEIHPVLSHLESVEKFDIPERFFVDLIRVYGQNRMFQDAIDLFFRIPRFRCVPSAYSLNALLSILCRNRGHIRTVPEILVKCHCMSVRVDESSFLILIKALCRIGKVGNAIKLLNHIIEAGFIPDDKMYSVILSSLCKSKAVSWSEVIRFFEDIKNDGFVPSRADYSTVINSLVKQGRGMEALDVLGEMKGDGIKPDIICYTLALRGVIEHGDFRRAEDLFDEILVFGLVPDIHTYNVYINGLCKQGNIEAGYKMICCIEQLECKPDSVTYNTILDAFCRSRELSRAKEVFAEMKLKGVQLNLQTYSLMLIASVSGGDVHGAFEFLEEMLSKRLVPLSSTVDEVVDALCEGGFVSEALQMLKKLAGYSVAPGVRGWEKLVLQMKVDSSEIQDIIILIKHPKMQAAGVWILIQQKLPYRKDIFTCKLST
ncbi:hypothetical protein V2J09_007056 [Rumex salicifolius]